jgi:Adenylate and Guanylate cyclase catalytic domain
MAVSRRLVAVFAADVEGYSRLMGADEVGTLKGLTERRAILDRLVGKHRGRIANTAGDSVLAELGSAVEAVQCALAAQTALAEANSGLAPDRRISFRIGIHIGDVLGYTASWCDLVVLGRQGALTAAPALLRNRPFALIPVLAMAASLMRRNRERPLPLKFVGTSPRGWHRARSVTEEGGVCARLREQALDQDQEPQAHRDGAGALIGLCRAFNLNNWFQLSIKFSRVG